MALNDQLKRLADLLVLQQRLRQSPVSAELASALVNDTRQLFPYRTAWVWSRGGITAVSGLPQPAANAVFTQWARSLCRAALREFGTKACELLPERLPPAVTGDWSDHVPRHLAWLPLTNAGGELQGVLVLARDTAWKPEQLRVLQHVASAAGHALEALRLKREQGWRPLARQLSGKGWILAATALLLLLALPIRLSAVVSAEVVPREPFVVRSPLDGVIGDIVVTPNALVDAGDTLLFLDQTSLQSRLDVARQELGVAQAEYLRAEQSSILDRNASAQLFLLNSRVEQRSSEVSYVEELLARSDIKADTAGLVMMEDITELKGRPVRVGEKILTIADPGRVELEAWLPVDDSLPLDAQAPLDFFLNIAPTRPLAGKVARVDYQAQVSPAGILAFRIRADLEPGELPRIGLRGSARVYGERVSLFYYLLRKPLAYLRPFFRV